MVRIENLMILISMYLRKDSLSRHCIYRSMLAEDLGYCKDCDLSLNNGTAPCMKFRLDKLPIL